MHVVSCTAVVDYLPEGPSGTRGVVALFIPQSNGLEVHLPNVLTCALRLNLATQGK